MNIFNTTRIKLTFWYVLLIGLISITVSVVVYSRVSSLIETEYEAIESKIRAMSPVEYRTFFIVTNQVNEKGIRRFLRVAKSAQLEILSEELRTTKKGIIIQLIGVNFLIIFMFSLAGYFLSGKTLRPIRDGMERQRQFIGDAAHEFRTPLTGLKTSLEVNMMDEKMPKKIKEILNENLEDINNLESLTQNLLRLSQYDEQSFDVEKISIKELIEKTVKTFQLIAKEKNIILKIEDISENHTIIGNIRSLIDLVRIFIDNALKYTESGGQILINSIAKGNQVTIVISDTGIGIEEASLPYIFDRFYRADSARSKELISGYGLGLSLAKKIVEKHRGSIEVKSRIGRGTTFSVSIPKNMKSNRRYFKGLFG